MSRNVNPGEGGPAGGQLEAKIGAFYFLSMLAEAEPRGMPGCTATKVKFQRTHEGHALDDIIVLGVDADGNDRVLEIQSKRTTDFTASDAAFGKTVAQIVAAGPDHVAPVAIAIARTNAKIERHYQQLLLLARKTSTAEAFARAVAAERVVSQGMRDFAAASWSTRATVPTSAGPMPTTPVRMRRAARIKSGTTWTLEMCIWDIWSSTTRGCRTREPRFLSQRMALTPSSNSWSM